jgi:hypothetical protein
MKNGERVAVCFAMQLRTSGRAGFPAASWGLLGSANILSNLARQILLESHKSGFFQFNAFFNHPF